MKATKKENLQEIQAKRGIYKGDHLDEVTRKFMREQRIWDIIYLCCFAVLIKWVGWSLLGILLPKLPESFNQLTDLLHKRPP